ncbi:class I SAM-dependent methyltransferase [Rhodovibrionaceae bacterium A322]
MAGEIKIDIGCGGAKRDGFLGLDVRAMEGVDHVLDLSKDRYPFEDNSVDHIYSSHFFEHLFVPDHFFREVGRIAKPGARIEIWTPYTFSSEAFVFGHNIFLTELFWQHFCVIHPDDHAHKLQGRWILHEIKFVVSHETFADLKRQGIPLEFALKYMKDVAIEFGAIMEFQPDKTIAPPPYRTSYAFARFDESMDIPSQIETESAPAEPEQPKAQDLSNNPDTPPQIEQAQKGLFERHLSALGGWLDRRTYGLKVAIKGQ